MGESERPKTDAKSGTEEDEPRPPAGRLPDAGHEVPLFLRDRSDGQRGNAQDEKDETGE